MGVTRRMSLVRWMILGFVLLGFFLLSQATLGLTGNQIIGNSQTKLVQETAQVAAANDILQRAIDLEGYGVSIVTAGNAGGTNTAIVTLAQRDVGAIQVTADSLLASEDFDEETTAGLQGLKSAADAYYVSLASLVTTASDTDEALAMLSEQTVPLATQLREAATAYRDMFADDLSATVSSLGAFSNQFMWAMISIGLANIGLAALVGVLVVRKIRGSLRKAVASISTSASELMAVATQVTASASQTAASTTETSTTVEEVKQTAVLANEKASLVSDSSRTVAEAAECERAAIDAAISAFARIYEHMELVAATIGRLDEQTKAVGAIMTTVNDLAEQSHLLSVNAAIEAAKAGEHGRGFAVVAQEVKSLAEQSKSAVVQVHGILEEIQKASATAVRVAEQSRDVTIAGKDEIEVAGQSTLALATSAEDTAQAAIQITASSTQQLVGMEQISQAVSNINAAATQSAAGTKQVEGEIQKLRELALDLRRLTDSAAVA